MVHGVEQSADRLSPERSTYLPDWRPLDLNCGVLICLRLAYVRRMNIFGDPVSLGFCGTAK